MGCPFARARVCQSANARMARGRGCRHHRGRGGRTATWSWIALAQASQLSQAVPQDVARPFAPQLPQVVPQVQAQARRGA